MFSDEPHKIVILDYQSGQVFVLDYDPNIYDDAEEFFATEEMSNFSYSDCHYMTVMAKDLQISFSID